MIDRVRGLDDRRAVALPLDHRERGADALRAIRPRLTGGPALAAGPSHHEINMSRADRAQQPGQQR
jgi:hypothetical protein